MNSFSVPLLKNLQTIIPERSYRVYKKEGNSNENFTSRRFKASAEIRIRGICYFFNKCLHVLGMDLFCVVLGVI